MDHKYHIGYIIHIHIYIYIHHGYIEWVISIVLLKTVVLVEPLIQWLEYH